MTDMGIYFEPPRKQAKKKWEVMQLLAESGYKFQTEGGKVYIEKFILRAKNPRLSLVKKTIEADKEARLKSEQEQRLKRHKEERGKL